MLEHLPRWLGGLLHNVRAGHSKLVIVDPDIRLGDTIIELSSTAFDNGGRLPTRSTADGDGLSPPLAWGPLPEGTKSVAIVVQDPDAPLADPFVHAVALAAPSNRDGIAENGLAPGHEGVIKAWIPPDPPPGHGVHDYVFQIFALREVPAFGDNPSRSDIVEAFKDIVLAAGLLTGTYARGEG